MAVCGYYAWIMRVCRRFRRARSIKSNGFGMPALPAEYSRDAATCSYLSTSMYTGLIASTRWQPRLACADWTLDEEGLPTGGGMQPPLSLQKGICLSGSAKAAGWARTQRRRALLRSAAGSDATSQVLRWTANIWRWCSLRGWRNGVRT
jgi:hypothetical protein